MHNMSCLQADSSGYVQKNEHVEVAAIVWERVSNALAAGAFALSPSAAAVAFQQVKEKKK